MGGPSPRRMHRALALADIAYFLTDGPVPRAKMTGIEGNNATVGEIVGPMVVSQEFVSADDGLQSLALLMATYGHQTLQLSGQLRAARSDGGTGN